MRQFIFALMAAVSLSPAMAQDAGLKALSTGDASRGWDAVGRIDIEGKGFCTGALIRENLVLTAAHCVFDKDGSEITPDRFSFLSGFREGRAEAYRDIARVTIHPDYEPRSGTDPVEVARDLAVLQLERPIRTTRIQPYPVALSPKRGEEIGLVSYAVGRETAPSLQDICSVLGQQKGIIIMTCSVDFGASGSPVFRLRDGVREIVSVVTAMSEVSGEPVSLGASLDVPLTALLQAHDTPRRLRLGTPRIVGADERSDTGAKFVRP